MLDANPFYASQVESNEDPHCGVCTLLILEANLLCADQVESNQDPHGAVCTLLIALSPLKIHTVALRSQHLPLPERLAPRPSKPGTLDLTASNLIVNDLAMHARIGTCARQIKRVVDVGRGQLKFGAAVEALMQLLHSIHAIWRTKTRLTADQCAAYHPGPSKEREGLLPKPLLGSDVGV